MTASILIDRVAADAAVAALANTIREWWAETPAFRSDPEKKAVFVPLLRDVMFHLSITQSELARILAIDPNTVTRWMSHNSTPRVGVLGKLDSLVDEVMLARGLGSLVTSPHSKFTPAVLMSEDIARRKHLASHLWIMKWNRGFLSGRDPHLYDAMDKVIRDYLARTTDDDNNGDEPAAVYHYVFPSRQVLKEMNDLPSQLGDDYYGDHPDTAAERSFDDMRKRLLEEHRNQVPSEAELQKLIDSVLHGHRVNKLAEVLRLGIPRAELGYFMIQYRASVRRQIGRDFDIFVEMDAPVAEEDQPTGLVQQSRTFWVQQTQEVALAMWRRWEPILTMLCDDLKPKAEAAVSATDKRRALETADM